MPRSGPRGHVRPAPPGSLPRVEELVRFLTGASSLSVRECEVSRLCEAEQLQRQLQELLRYTVQVYTEANLCRLVLELREGSLSQSAVDDMCPGLRLLGSSVSPVDSE